MASTVADRSRLHDVELQPSETAATQPSLEHIDTGPEPKTIFLRICKNLSTVW